MVATFITFGLFWGSWAVMVFNIQHTFALSDAALGFVLALAIAVAGASSAVMAGFSNSTIFLPCLALERSKNRWASSGISLLRSRSVGVRIWITLRR